MTSTTGVNDMLYAFFDIVPLVDSSDLSVFAEVCSALMDLNK